MLFFLYGTDSFRINQYLKKIRTKFVADRDPQGLNTHQFSATDASEEQVLQVYATPPFLAEKKMIILHDFLVEAKKFEPLVKKIQVDIEAKAIPADTIMVFVETNNKWRTKVAKELAARLQQEQYAQEFLQLEGAQLGGWVATEVAERGGSINRQAANQLATNVGDEMWALHHTIDQLVAFCGEREVSPSDVEQFLPEAATDNIFQLVDTIFARKGTLVFSLLQAQYNAGSDAGYVFAMLIRQCRILLQLASFEGPAAGAAKALGIHPFVVKKSGGLLKQINQETLQSFYTTLLSIDMAVKTGKGQYESQLQSLLLDWCSA